jgi:hypothetical protein
MSCGISPVSMAHQWRGRVCAITIGALGKTNGAKHAPLGFSQWSANGAMALPCGLADRNPTPRLSGRHREARDADFDLAVALLGRNLSVEVKTRTARGLR